MKKIRTGIVGVGFVGLLHIEALRRLGNVDVVAICDNFDAEKRGKDLFIEHTYSDYKKMIDQENLDYIHICTPNNSHFEIAKYAMDKNVNVVLEKPMTYTIDEAKELYLLSEEKKTLVCAVNFHNRLYTAPAYIHNIIQKDEMKRLAAEGKA